MLNERGGRLAITPSFQVPSCSASTGAASILLRAPGPQHWLQSEGFSTQKAPETLSRVQMITNTQRQFKPILFYTNGINQN